MQVEIEIVGTSPLLQHRFSEEFEVQKSTRTVAQEQGTPREEASKVVYKDSTGRFYFPGTWISSSLREAGSNHKLRGSRKSIKYVIPAAIRIVEVEVFLRNGDGNLIKDFEVDSRPITIPATKGRIMRHRPRFDCWSAEFNMTINTDLLSEEFVHKLLNEAGQSQGIGDFRPNKSGPFGCFRVVSWAQIE